MKIAIDISQVAYENTGVANYTSELVKNLLKQDKKNQYLLFGYSLRREYIINKFFSTLSLLNSNVQWKSFRIPQSAANFLWNRLHQFPLEKLIGKFDIYHSSDWIQIPSSAKKITTVHDLVVYKFPQTSDPNIVETQKIRLKHVKNECNLTIADSNSTKNDLLEVLDFDPNKIRVVYPGINKGFKKINDHLIFNILRKYNITQPYILSVGSNDPRKNIKKIVSAVKKFEKRTALVIVSSSGWGEKFTEDQGIKILHNIKTQDLPAIYSAAEMFIYPSLYEGFGLPVIEAMKCGCPVISSERGSLKEITDNSALLVNPESEMEIFQAIVKIFKNNKYKKDLIKSGYLNAERFSWEDSAKKIISIYEELNNL